MRKTLNNTLLLLLFPLLTFSQEQDFLTYTTIGLSKDLVKNTTISFDQSIRFRENSSILSIVFSELSCKININKQVSLAAGYRFINRWDIQDHLEQTNRFFGSVSFKQDLTKRMKISTNIKLQTQGNQQEYSSTFRHKTNLSYNLKKTKLYPSLSAEYFVPTATRRLEKLRYSLSFAYPITKKIDAELAYQIQNDINVSNPETLFIFDGKLTYQF